MVANPNIRTLFLHAGTGTQDIVDTTKLESISKWTGAGFASLTAVLTFFGIKEGALDTVLREQQRPSLVVFCLVGAGVVGALLTSAVAGDLKLRFFWVVLFVAVLGVGCSYVFDDFVGQRGPSDEFLILVVIATVVLVILTRNTPISLAAAGLVMSVILVSTGLYGAAKLAVQSKTTAAGTQLGAKLVPGSDGAVVEVDVTATRRSTESRLAIEVYGQASSTGSKDELVGRAVLEATATGELDSAFSFPIAANSFERVSVRTCESKAAPCGAGTERASLAGGRSSLDRDVAGSLTIGADGLAASVAGDGLRRGSTMRVAVIRVGKQGGKKVATAVLKPDAAGKVTWTGAVNVNTAGATKFQLRYRTCQAGTCRAPIVLASTPAS